MRNLVFALIVFSGCGKSPPASAPPLANAPTGGVGAPPGCRHDAAWRQATHPHGGGLLAVVGGTAAMVWYDDDGARLVITAVDTGDELATMPLEVGPGRQGVIANVATTGDEVAILVEAIPDREDEPTTERWLARVSSAGRFVGPPAPIQLPARTAWNSYTTAVGDRIVVCQNDNPYREDGESRRADRMTSIRVIGPDGRIVAALEEPGETSAIAALGDHAAAVVLGDATGDRQRVRVLDLRRNTWTGPARPSPFTINDLQSLDAGRAIALGWAPDAPQELRPLHVATVGADGLLSPWQELGIEANGSYLFTPPRANGTYLVWESGDGTRFATIDPALRVAADRAPSAVGAGSGLSTINVGRAMYTLFWGSILRFECDNPIPVR